MTQSEHTYQITGHTRLICLLGNPVSHSKSPVMHNEGFRQLGLDYCYLAFQADEDSLEKTVEGLKLLNCRGFNLTMPVKIKWPHSATIYLLPLKSADQSIQL